MSPGRGSTPRQTDRLTDRQLQCDSDSDSDNLRLNTRLLPHTNSRATVTVTDELAWT
jgi:hypothetical protein